MGTSSKTENQDGKIIQMLKEQLAHSNQQNKELLKQVEALTHQVRQLTKLLYGSKTEKSRYNPPDGQTSLFDDDCISQVKSEPFRNLKLSQFIRT